MLWHKVFAKVAQSFHTNLRRNPYKIEDSELCGFELKELWS